MQKKLLSPLLLSCMLGLTACGGSGGDTSNTGNNSNNTENSGNSGNNSGNGNSTENSGNNSNNSGNDNNTTASNVDYNTAETVDLIAEPVLSLTKNIDHPVIDIAHFAEEIHYSTADPDKTGETGVVSCESGTVQKNNNGSATLNKCKSFSIDGKAYQYTEGLTLSGTILSIPTYTETTEQYDITLNNLTVNYGDGEVEVYHGNIVEKFTHHDGGSKAQFDITKMELTWTDKNEKEHYILSDYSLTETYTYTSSSATPAKAKGNLQGDINGQKFSVNFDSDLEYGWTASNPNISRAAINIEDTTNAKNSIKIERATNGQALVSAFVNSTSVIGFPKTVGWNDF